MLFSARIAIFRQSRENFLKEVESSIITLKTSNQSLEESLVTSKSLLSKLEFSVQRAKESCSH
jgi:hypothetical protein